MIVKPVKFLPVLIFACLVFQTNSYAGIYKCVNADGSTSYKDRPCSSAQKNKKVKIDKVKKLTPEEVGQQKLEAQRTKNEWNRLNRERQKLSDNDNKNYKAATKKRHFAKNKNHQKKSYTDYLKTKEKIGAQMSGDEKDWRNWDEVKMNKVVKKHNKIPTAEEMKQQQQIFDRKQRGLNEFWNKRDQEFRNPINTN